MRIYHTCQWQKSLCPCNKSVIIRRCSFRLCRVALSKRKTFFFFFVFIARRWSVFWPTRADPAPISEVPYYIFFSCFHNLYTYFSELKPLWGYKIPILAATPLVTSLSFTPSHLIKISIFVIRSFERNVFLFRIFFLYSFLGFPQYFLYRKHLFV